jgi:hypothetical protein
MRRLSACPGWLPFPRRLSRGCARRGKLDLQPGIAVDDRSASACRAGRRSALRNWSRKRVIRAWSRVTPTLRASSSTRGSKAAEAWLHRMGPLKPAASRWGMRPTWSMWTWVTTRARILSTGNSMCNRLAPAPSGEVSAPWNRPQSTSTDWPSGSVNWWQEPVTPSTAPWWVKWRFKVRGVKRLSSCAKTRCTVGTKPPSPPWPSP